VFGRTGNDEHGFLPRREEVPRLNARGQPTGMPSNGRSYQPQMIVPAARRRGTNMGVARDPMGVRSGLAAPGSNDRRRSIRYPVKCEDALLGWWDGLNFIHVPARFVNLSLEGCMLELDRVPARTVRESVWVRAREGSPDDWAEGVVLSVRKPLMRRCQVRVVFSYPFPHEAFLKVVYDSVHAEPTERAAVPHELDHYWR
jgi:hypothetical protein